MVPLSNTELKKYVNSTAVKEAEVLAKSPIVQTRLQSGIEQKNWKDIILNCTYRWEIFLAHVEYNIPIKSSNGEDIQIPNDFNGLDKKAFIEKVKSVCSQATGENDPIWHNLSTFNSVVKAFDKTAEFGAGGGTAGAGSKKTAIVEATIACLCGRLSTEQGGNFNDHIDINMSKSVLNQFGGSSSLLLSTSSNEYLIDAKWDLESSAQVIVDFVSGSDFKNPVYHWQSNDFVKKVSTAFKKLKKNTDFESLDLNKWNPADIWVTEGSGPDLSAASDLKTLGEILYNPGSCVGISLKKGGKTLDIISSQPIKYSLDYLEDIPKSFPKPTLGKKTWESKFILSKEWKTNNSDLVNPKNREITLSIRPDRGSLKAEAKVNATDYREGSIGTKPIIWILQKHGLAPELSRNVCEKESKVLKNLALANKNFNKDDKELQEQEKFLESQNIDPHPVDLEEKFKKVGLTSDEVNKASLDELTDYIQEYHLYFALLDSDTRLEVLADIVKLSACDWEGHCTYWKIH